MLTSVFNGDLSSLCRLLLESVRTELPWRNVVNLISFRLAYTLPGEVSVGQLLDFFENTPYLRESDPDFATPTSGARDGQLVSLVCLKGMNFIGNGPSPLLLNRLLIPVGVESTTGVDFVGSLTRGSPPQAPQQPRELLQLHNQIIRWRTGTIHLIQWTEWASRYCEILRCRQDPLVA